MFKVQNKKGMLIVLGALISAALLVWIPIIGRFSLEDPQPVPVEPAVLSRDPAPFLGRRVTVEGEIGRVYGPRAFSLERGAPGDAPLLVVGRKPWALLQKQPQVDALIRNDRVQITGRVRRFKLRDYQAESGRHAADSLLAAFEGRPAVLAQDIELTPGVPDYLPGPQGRGGAGGSDGDAGSADSARRGGPEPRRAPP